MKISISKDLLEKVPEFSVIAYTMDVDNQSTPEVEELLRSTESKYQNLCDLTDVVVLPKLKASRDGYKKLGKDPSRYRLATEALIRRVIRGLPLYRLGDLIDLGNVLSIMTQRSICVVDLDKIQGDIYIRIGTSDDSYEGINRGPINIERMPVYTDDWGPFGTPTSDTMRTAVTDESKRILVMMICFHEAERNEDEACMLELYKRYANATNIKKLTYK